MRNSIQILNHTSIRDRKDLCYITTQETSCIILQYCILPPFSTATSAAWTVHTEESNAFEILVSLCNQVEFQEMKKRSVSNSPHGESCALLMQFTNKFAVNFGLQFPIIQSDIFSVGWADSCTDMTWDSGQGYNVQ